MTTGPPPSSLSTQRGHEITDVLGETLQSWRASPVFAFYLLVTLGIAVIIGLITFDVIDLGMSHFGQLSHRTHDIAYGLLFTTGVVGVLAQLRRPDRNVAAMVMALIPAGSLVLAGLFSNDLDLVVQRNPLRYAAGVTVVAALVHPAGRGFFRSFGVSRISWVMLTLVGLAAVPLLGFAFTNIGLQRTVTDMHAVMGHYGFAVASSFTVIAVGVLASLRPMGWRITAWVGGLLPAILGVTSLLYPDASSSFGAIWATAAIFWGVTFILAASLAKDMGSPPAHARRQLPHRRDASLGPTSDRS